MASNKKNASLQRSLSAVFWGGVATSATDTLALGPTLIAYAALFGAGNITFGLLGAVPYIGNLIHLPTAALIERGYSVKKLSVFASLLSRPFYFFVALLAFVPQMPGALALLILLLTGSYLIGCVAGGAWQPWMKQLVPPRLTGRFFAERFKYMMVAKIICFLITSFTLNVIIKKYPAYEIYAYATLFFAAALIGLFGSLTLLGVKNKKIPTKPAVPFWTKVRETFKNQPFCRLLWTLSFMTLTSTFIVPFITVYMLRALKTDVSFVLILTLISQLSYVYSIRRWGRSSDSRHPIRLLKGGTFFLILTLVGFTGLSLGTAGALGEWGLSGALVILNLMLGIANAGIALGLNNASLLYVPEEMSAVYLSVNSVFKSCAGVVGAFTAGLVLNLCSVFEKAVGSSNGNGWPSFFAIGFVLCLATLTLITSFKKEEKKA